MLAAGNGEHSSAPGVATASGARMLVELRDVALTYGRGGMLAVEHLGLEIAEGELLAVVGPSGCGKSTLMKLVSGLARPTQGSVSVAGEPVTKPLKIVGM